MTDGGSRKQTLDTPCPAIRKLRQGVENHSDLFDPPKRRVMMVVYFAFHLQESNLVRHSDPLDYMDAYIDGVNTSVILSDVDEQP